MNGTLERVPEDFNFQQRIWLDAFVAACNISGDTELRMAAIRVLVTMLQREQTPAYLFKAES